MELVEHAQAVEQAELAKLVGLAEVVEPAELVEVVERAKLVALTSVVLKYQEQVDGVVSTPTGLAQYVPC